MKYVRERNKYHILTHIYGIYKDGTDELICRAGQQWRDTDIETYGHLMGGGEGGTNGKSSMETRTTICKVNVKMKVT